MSGAAALRQADQARREAMIAADATRLEALLADDLTWTHSSGVTETKREFVGAIVEGRVVYEVLEITDDQVRGAGDMLIHEGMLTGRASRNKQTKALAARFLAVWREVDGHLQLLAWQSTNRPTD